MSYIDQETNLEKTVADLPASAQAVFSERPVISTMEGIGGEFDLTRGEIGWLCEFARQIITHEKAPKDFVAGIQEKLAEENQPRAAEITARINELIFIKLLPLLGIEHLPFLPKASVLEASPASVTPAQELPPRQVPLNKIIPPTPAKTLVMPSPRPLPPIPPNLPTQNPPESFTAPVKVMPPQPAFGTIAPRPPILETSHAGMSENPMESLMKMVDGKIGPKELQDRFAKLPESLKTALKSVDSAKKVVDIGRKYALHVDKIGILGAETGMVILGSTHPGQFLGRLMDKLDVDEEKVRPIAQEINTEIFLKIREALKEVNGEGGIAPKIAVPQSGEFSAWPQQTSYAKPVNTAHSEAEETLDRDSILRDIENPTRNNPAPSFTPKPQAPVVNPVQKPIVDRPSGITVPPVQQTKTPEPLPTKEGFTPPVSQIAPTSYVPAPEAVPTTPKPQSIMDQKLSSTTASKKTESRYSIDPYRESAE